MAYAAKKTLERLLRNNVVVAPLAVVVMILFVYAMATIFGKSGEKLEYPYTEEEIARIDAERRTTFDPRDPLVLVKDVDYAEGESADWYPKGESPMLAELVEQGKLPPVAERVGPEPLVVEGVDGIGNYGGTLAMGTSNLNQDPGFRIYYVGFARWSPQGMPLVPYLARSWDISDDQTTFTFHLRKGLRWSDGHPFTSEDVMFAYHHGMGVVQYYKKLKKGLNVGPPGLPCGLKIDTKVEAPDAYTVRFTFAEPYGIFPYKLSTFLGERFFHYPKHYLSQFWFDYDEDMSEYNDPEIQTRADLFRNLVPEGHHLRKYYQEHAEEFGSFGDIEIIERVVAEKNLPNAKALWGQINSFNNPECPRMSPWIVRHQALTPPFEYVRNPYFPVVDTQGNQLPYTDRLFMEAKDAKMLDVAVAQGNFSFHPFVDGFIDYTYMMSQREAGDYDIHHWYSADSTKFTIQFNTNRRGPAGEKEWKNKRELFTDVRFRRAMSLAIDRQSIIDALYSGIGEPAQNMPRKESLFYDEEALYKYTEHDPEEANRLLDEAGYTQRDSEGFRTFKDGSKMMLIFTILDPLWEGMARFIIDDWAEVGVRAYLVVQSRTLFDMAMRQQTYDIYTWTGNNEYYPLLDPRFFVPGTQCGYAPAFAQWYGRLGRGQTPAEIKALGLETVKQPPPGGVIDRVYKIYQRACRESDPKKQAEIFAEAIDLTADSVWAIGVVSAPPTLAVVKNDLRNVPKMVVSAWDFLTPTNAYPETFYLEEPSNPEAVTGELQRQIVEAQYEQESARIETTLTEKDGGLIGTVIAWAFALVVILFIIHACLRRPYLARRLLLMVPTLFIISVIVFTMIQLPDGDFITNRIAMLESQGQSVDPEEIEQIKNMFYMNDPQVVRYMKWMGLKWFVTFDQQDKGLLQGFMGYSMQTQRPVNSMIGDRLLLTMLIASMTILFMWAVSMPLGLYCAVKQYSLADYLLTFIGFLGMCIPNFVLALFFIYLAQTQFGLRISGLFSPEFAADPTWSWAKIVDLLKHLWVPVIVSAAAGTGGGIRGTRANMLDELRKPYVRTALAKGVHPLKVFIKYPFRMTLNPFVSGIGNIFPMLVSGGALIAIVLSLPTIGPLQLEAVIIQDMYMAGSMMMMFTLLGVIGTLVSDLLLLVLDPRIRYTGGSR